MKKILFPIQNPQKIKIVLTGAKKRELLTNKPYISWGVKDELSRRIAIVQLYTFLSATHTGLSELFGLHKNSIQKHISDLKKEGAAGLMPKVSGPKEKWKLTTLKIEEYNTYAAGFIGKI